jgi:hypothetical protein
LCPSIVRPSYLISPVSVQLAERDFWVSCELYEAHTLPIPGSSRSPPYQTPNMARRAVFWGLLACRLGDVLASPFPASQDVSKPQSSGTVGKLDGTSVGKSVSVHMVFEDDCNNISVCYIEDFWPSTSFIRPTACCTCLEFKHT